MPAAIYSHTAAALARRPENSAHAVHGKLGGARGETAGVQTKAREPKLAGFTNNAGSDLLSHTVSHAVPSAVAGLTSVFGMGTGVSLLL